MKKAFLSIIFISLTGALMAQPLDRSIKPKPGPAPEIKLGKTESFTLPNGMKVFVVENHKLPTLECSLQLDIRPELEGAMTGYRELMSELLLSGTATRSKDKLNAAIDQMGANIEVNDRGISGSGLKKYQSMILDIMADIVRNTKITQDELDRSKKKKLSELQTQKNQPDAMVRNVSAVVDFGANHPYGEVASEETVKKITLAACTKYYKTYFRPNVAYMAIVGDVTMSEIKPLIEKYFGKWEKKDVPVTRYIVPDITATGVTRVAFAPRVGAVQSVVSVTYPLDLKPGTPDVIKARVANTVLGGGSQGRLFLDLREKHAWTYGAYSSLRDDELCGSFSATVKCRNAVSDSSINAILDEMKAMSTEKVGDSTLQNSITYLSGNFAIGLEDPNRVAQYAINIERYHMPHDYYQNYLKNLSAVTADDIVEMSKKYIHPDKANIVVAGSKEDVAPKLARFASDGKINYYDFTGQPISNTESVTVPAATTAEMVFKKYIAAMGGEKGFSSIKDIRITGKSESQGMPLTITEIKKAPNKWKQTIDVAFNGQTITQKMVYDGTKGWQEANGQKADLKGDDLEDIKMSADIAMDLHPEKYGIKRTLKGMEKINGSNAYVLSVVDGKGKKSVEYYDAASYLLVRKIQGEGEKTQSSDYSDYKEVAGTGGYKVPYKVTETQSGQTISETVTNVEVNTGINDSDFN